MNLKNIFNKFSKSEYKKVLTILTFVFLLIAITGYIMVEFYFSMSGFPVPLIQGQLCFSGNTLRGYYSMLVAQSNLGKYIFTQFVDFIFIVGLTLFGTTIHLLFATKYQINNFWRKLAYFGFCLFVISGIADFSENIISFIMMANIDSFPAFLGIIYSIFAFLKWSIALIGIPILLVELAMYLFAKKLK